MEYFNLNEVSKYLRKSKSSIYKWCTNGQIPHIKAGKNLLFNRDVIDEWLSAHSVPTKDEIGNSITKLLKSKQ